MLLLILMKKEMEISYFDTTSTTRKNLGLFQLMALPYHLRAPISPHDSPEALPHAGVNLFGTSDTAQAPISSTSLDSPTPRASPAPRAETWPQQSSPTLNRSPTIPSLTYDSAHKTPTVVIRINMPHDFGVRSWRWYEAILEALAVGFYLYATFVLTSTLFISGEMALVYAIVMTLCLSGVRILGTLF